MKNEKPYAFVGPIFMIGQFVAPYSLNSLDNYIMMKVKIEEKNRVSLCTANEATMVVCSKCINKAIEKHGPCFAFVSCETNCSRTGNIRCRLASLEVSANNPPIISKICNKKDF